MNEKITIQELVEHISESKGLQKKEVENFIKEFFKLIENALKEERYVKIKGFGTFKLIEVDSRQSVNVNTGERFEIQGHTKVTFTPDAALKDMVNKPFAHFESVILNEGALIDDMPADEDDAQPSIIEDEPIIDDTQPTILEDEPIINDAQPTILEDEPIIDDAQSAILEDEPIINDAQPTILEDEPIIDDAQPAILEDKPIIDDAQPTILEDEPIINDAQPTILEDEPIINDAQPTILEDEPIIDDAQSAILEDKPIIDENIVEEDSVVKEEKNINEEEENKSNDFMANTIANIESDLESKQQPESMIKGIKNTIANDFKDTKSMKYFFGIVIFIILLCILAITFLYYPTLLTDMMPKTQTEEITKAETIIEKDVEMDQQLIEQSILVSDSINSNLAISSDSIKESDSVVVQQTDAMVKENLTTITKPEEKIATTITYDVSSKYTIIGTQTEHVIKKGETLRIISLNYFGTKELSNYIVEHNKDVIKNPNNVAIGTKIKIPKLEKNE